MQKPLKLPQQRPLPPGQSQWEEQIQALAQRFPYPPTPDLAGKVNNRLTRATVSVKHGRLRLVWAMVLALLLLSASLFAVPSVRARLLDWLQIGSVRIWLVEPTPTLFPKRGPTPRPTPTPLTSLFNLAGATTLAEAQRQVDFTIQLPSYPSSLGAPDGVYVQEIGGPVVVLVWTDPAQPTHILLSLHILGRNTFAEKGNATRLAQTTVNGQPAYWTEGPYILAYRRGNAIDFDLRRLVEGHVLLWRAGSLTYRLETDWSMAEAVRMAESLTPLPPPDLNFAGKTTLAKAQEQLSFPIRLPAYPADLGAPDHVFVQQTNGWFVVLLWMEPADRQRVRLVLYELEAGVGLEKGPPPILRHTHVNDRPALWIEGLHYLEHVTNGWNPVRLIDHDVLVWSETVEQQIITYRLETALSEAAAIQIAASLDKTTLVTSKE